MMKSRSFTVIIHKEDDIYVAECPEVGTVDQGETIEQAIAGLREATRLYLEAFPVPETSVDDPDFEAKIQAAVLQQMQATDDNGEQSNRFL